MQPLYFPPMSYELRQTLKPGHVGLDLLQRVEALLREDVSQTLLDGESGEVEYTMVISEGFGEETFRSVRDYRPKRLPDAVTKVEMRLWTRRVSPSVYSNLKLSFGLDDWDTRLELSTSGQRAREKAVAIAERVEQILAPHRGRHRFLHVSLLMSGVRAGLLFVAGLAAVYRATQQDLGEAFVWFLVALAAGAHWYAGAVLRPYTIFDTLKNERAGNQLKWLIGLFLTFAVSGVMLTYLRQKFLGF